MRSVEGAERPRAERGDRDLSASDYLLRRAPRPRGDSARGAAPDPWRIEV